MAFFLMYRSFLLFVQKYEEVALSLFTSSTILKFLSKRNDRIMALMELMISVRFFLLFA
jgi:hypothetical protein